MTDEVAPRSPELLKTLVERLVGAGISPAGPVQALQMDALMQLLVGKGLVTKEDWDGALAERIGNALSRIPEQPKVVTLH